MDYKTAKELLDIEYKCIERSGTCDRKCEKCDLVQEEDELKEAYMLAIGALETVTEMPEHNVPDKNVGKSNADKIRAMSDEELAKYLSDSDACPYDKCLVPYENIDCDICWLDFLKQEVSDG